MDVTAEQQNNKRIAKNTLLLYFRMLVTMAVSLYTSRVILQTLGVEDFGIYNVVGGVVAMFSILSGSMSAAISRFLSFELGKNNQDQLSKIFSTAVTIQFLLTIVVVIVAETIGIWFLNNKMEIPQNRIYAANWAFQLSLLTFGVNLISVPYNAAIIAHERMSAFAYISVLEAFGKLAIAWMIVFSCSDKLILYAILMSALAMITRFIYGWYCKKHFWECSYHFVFDKPLLKQMFGFAGWNFIGASSAVLRDQGGNIILNLFFGPAVNAARGVAVQVQNAISQFSTSFMTAVTPQITKSYANGNHDYMMSLVYQSARLSYYLLFFLSLPILLNADYILSIWLKTVPEHSIRFVQLILIFVLSESIASPLVTAMLATGDIRNYQIIVGGLQMLNLPVAYILLKQVFFPESVFVTAIVISQCCLLARLILLKRMISLRICRYLKQVYFNVVLVSALSTIVPLIVKKYLLINSNIFNFIVICAVSVICTSLVIWKIGLNGGERNLVKNKMVALKKRILYI
jgi:O-antigen/teichoic acid export membrane protein